MPGPGHDDLLMLFGESVAAGPPLPATLFFDTFTDVATPNLPVHTPDLDSDGDPAWQSGSGTFGIAPSLDKARQTEGIAGASYVTAGTSESDIEIEVDVLTSASNNVYSGIAFRQAAGPDYLAVYVNAQDDLVTLASVDNGVGPSNIATATLVVSQSTQYHFRVRAVGTSVQVWIDEVLLIDAVTAFSQLGLDHGLFQWDSFSDVRWDDFLVTEAA